MGQTLTTYINILAYSDGQLTNNPQMRDFDYQRRLTDVPTDKVRSEKHMISVQETENIMSIQRAITSGASWTVSNPTGVTSRLTWSTVNPILRTERVGGALTIGATITAERQAQSQVVKLTFSALPAAGIIANDELFLGAGSGLSILNQGIFKVAAAYGNVIEVLSYDMINETAISITDPTDVYAFSNGPVRVGDFLKVSNSAFNYGNRGEFQITQVTSRWVEVQNSNIVPEGPITADFVVYEKLYKFMYIEVDQPVQMTINGTQTISVEPISAGSQGMVGVFMLRGPVYSVSIYNAGSTSANVTSFFAV